MKEIHMEINPSEENRAEFRKEEAKLRKFLKIKEEYWKQKTGMSWFIERTRILNYFIPMLKGEGKS